MKKHIISKKGFFALALCASFAYPMLILSAASSSSSSGSCHTGKTEMTPYYAATSSSCIIEPPKELSHPELKSRLATLRALQIDPFLAQRKPKSLAEIAHGFAQRTLQEYEYAVLNRKYLLPKEEPAKCMESITGRFSLRYKIIGKFFQEYQENKLSFEDLFAIAQHNDSLAQLASFVYFALHKETTWNDGDILIGWKIFGPWECPQKMECYPKKLLPYLGIALEEYIAYNKAPNIIAPHIGSAITANKLMLTRGHLASLDGIEAIPGIEGVEYLFLDNNKLSVLPDFISNLTKLKCLRLNNNQLTTLPCLIGDLTNLEDLILLNNQLTALPDFIGNLTQLKILNLTNNQLTALPDSVSNLRNLQYLWLSNNQLTIVPDSVCNLTQLKGLSLNDNKLTALPNSVGNLTQLESLCLDNNQLTTLPYSISNLTKLARLNLYSNRFTALPDSLCNLTGLNHLSLGNNQLTALPYSIGDLTQLTHLDLHNNQLTTLPDSIRNLTHLQYLNLHNNNFSQTERNRITLMINQATAGQCRIWW